ncbi:UDP-N-acetylmuramoyl-tripeptide--D-alanyl-D-alanine ligase [Pajaroellobacter abortibovis]|uniref:UDP-N-acetylmuramoyl-tripeptide--D-alanyl-D-alanine ligase n=1 Tax=Pajaroellobacter abortibovis TaxID=1882918 RepID=A0A1L6MVX9_9BACT|nr:UDP-N-acetylmuramoyl-tripeptide--D-alanyl-D-alanine ligase [Pajaroellobacter abortibovis]APR99682.1 hypothetical protein BCY86_02580 [Pajaroellobacter abortibovis]
MATEIPISHAAFSVWSALAATGGVLRSESASDRFTVGITSDSRQVRPGNLFVALKGERYDGHDYVEAAVRAGASLVIVQREYNGFLGDADAIVVEDTLKAWGDLARAHVRGWRRSHACRVEEPRVCVLTGSAGKTTTKEFCASFLMTIGSCHFSKGNLNNRIGLPAVIFGLEPYHRWLVLEAAMNQVGEIAALASIAEPDVALITNIGVAHAAGVSGGRSGVAREKGVLFEVLSQNGTAIVNCDDAAVYGQLARTRAKHVRTFGRMYDADYRLMDHTLLGVQGARVLFERPRSLEGRGEREQIEVHIPLLSEVAALDMIGGLAAAEATIGRTIPVSLLHQALERTLFAAGRGLIFQLEHEMTLIDESYNANPSSMQAALHTLKNMATQRGGRAIAIVGEMRELGSLEASEHLALGDKMGEFSIDLAIGCGGAINLTLERAASHGVSVVNGNSVEEAIQAACDHVQPRDVVLVKASLRVNAARVVAALRERFTNPSIGIL